MVILACAYCRDPIQLDIFIEPEAENILLLLNGEIYCSLECMQHQAPVLGAEQLEFAET